MITKVNGYALFIVFTNIQTIIIHYGNTLNYKHLYIITLIKKLQLSKTSQKKKQTFMTVRFI